MAKPTNVEQFEMRPTFSKDDIKWFKRSLEKFTSHGREQYGKNLSDYEIFLISVAAINFYPDTRKVSAASYHDNDIENYIDKYVVENHPTSGETFRELTRCVFSDENRRKHRWIRDRFVPRAFWDALYDLI